MAKNFLSGLFGRNAPAPARDEAADGAATRPGLFQRLAEGLSRSSGQLAGGVAAIFTKKKLDRAMLDAFEETLIAADLGVGPSARIVAALAEGRFDKEISENEVRRVLAAEIEKTLAPLEAPLSIDPARKPHVILVVGVNGSGKTTTIGKLGAKFAGDGLKVLLAAGDTFRAAAIEQLSIWGARIDAPVVARAAGADAAGLAFDALKRAREEEADVLLVDTAGRLQNRRELMDELAKIVRVMKKVDPSAPHDVLLVLDATVGQNAISQAETFRDIAGVTGLVMTKLDGTARGGVLVALSDRFRLPIHFVGVGEGIEDLQAFDAAAFAKALAGVGTERGEDDAERR